MLRPSLYSLRRNPQEVDDMNRKILLAGASLALIGLGGAAPRAAADHVRVTPPPEATRPVVVTPAPAVTVAPSTVVVPATPSTVVVPATPSTVVIPPTAGTVTAAVSTTVRTEQIRAQ